MFKTIVESFFQNNNTIHEHTQRTKKLANSMHELKIILTKRVEYFKNICKCQIELHDLCYKQYVNATN